MLCKQNSNNTVFPIPDTHLIHIIATKESFTAPETMKLSLLSLLFFAIVAIQAQAAVSVNSSCTL